MTPRPPLGLLVALVVAVCLAACGEDAGERPRIRVATTTSTAETGLLDEILPPFEARERVAVDVVSVGTGQALEIGRRGDCDLVLVHDRKQEDAFVAEGHGAERRDLWWNEFVLVGPAEDPAKVKGGADAAAALAQIARAGARFISRGDKSGTHGRELSLWKKAGGRPEWEGYWETGQGMSATLTIADEKPGYTLADRGSWLAHRSRLKLVVLVEGDPALRNPYGGILVDPRKNPKGNAAGARRLLEYLSSDEVRRRLDAFRKDGEVLFHPPSGG